jgi:hypothetical protein
VGIKARFIGIALKDHDVLGVLEILEEVVGYVGFLLAGISCEPAQQLDAGQEVFLRRLVVSGYLKIRLVHFKFPDVRLIQCRP